MGKKLLSLTLALCLVLMALSGCWGNDDSSSSSSNTSSSSSSSSSSSNSMNDSSSGIMDGSDSMMDGSSDMTDSSNSMNSDSSMGDSSQNSKPAMAGTNSWETVLVNSQNPLPEDFTVDTVKIKGYEKEFDARAVDALNQMLADAEKAGHKCFLVSAYRSVSYQKGLFNRKVQSYLDQGYTQAEAEAAAATWVARPGTSEHNLGLAADIVSGDWYTYNNDLTEEFENTDAFTWLYANCASYGFVLRYPKDKTELTGISYEPWHYRYVGKQAAAYIMQNKICLEEFKALSIKIN